MRRALIFFALLLAKQATAEDSLHVYYYNGESIEQMSLRGVTVTVTLKDTGKLNQVAVYVDNGSSDAVNVIPSNIALHQNSPKDEDLRMKSEQEVQKIAGQRAFWGQVAAGVGTGLNRAKDKITADSEHDPSTKADPPGYDAQARWLAHVDELGQRGKTVTLGHAYLRGSTVFPGSKFAGVLWFDRDQAFASGMVRIALGPRTYLFPFPPPESATTPAIPGQPDAQKVPGKSLSLHQEPGAPSASKAGVLGVSGETWIEGGVGGVHILEVAQNSAAELAGLRAGFVITEVDAKRIRSTEDLAAALAQKGPGTRVSIAYLIRTNLGWMPKDMTVILGSVE